MHKVSICDAGIWAELFSYRYQVPPVIYKSRNTKDTYEQVDFLGSFLSTLLNLSLSDSTVSEDAGIEPRTVATSALAVSQTLSPRRLDLIHQKIYK
jgi:hypothetical protein